MSEFKQGILSYGDVVCRYAEAGRGTNVVIFPDGGVTPIDDIAMALAADHRVLVLDTIAVTRGEERTFASNLAFALANIGVGAFSVLGVAQGVTPALAQAIYTPEQIQGLILASPPLASVQSAELSTSWAEIKAPTLVLVGTRDRSGSREAGRLCRAQIPACYLLLVYEAGHAIATDRREACLSPIREFLTQGEGFIVSHDSQLIRP
jgi:pimeloyl-ACP methyl ester carboxylesterase